MIPGASLAAARRLPAILLTIGVLAVAGTWFAFCRPEPNPLPPAIEKTQDSLEATKPDYTRRRDTLVRVESIYVSASRQNRLEATKAARRADSLRIVAIAADSVARAQRDTSSTWRASADAWRAAAEALGRDTLRLAAAYSAESTARVAADVRADDAERRRSSLEKENGRIASALQRADRPCYAVPHLVGCPSRKVVAVLAAGAGAIAASTKARRAVTDVVRTISPFSLIPGVRP